MFTISVSVVVGLSSSPATIDESRKASASRNPTRVNDFFSYIDAPVATSITFKPKSLSRQASSFPSGERTVCKQFFRTTTSCAVFSFCSATSQNSTRMFAV